MFVLQFPDGYFVRAEPALNWQPTRQTSLANATCWETADGAETYRGLGNPYGFKLFEVQYTLKPLDKPAPVVIPPITQWPQNYRRDRELMERICPHGVGHPDPTHPSSKGEGMSVHGCDGCCTAAGAFTEGPTETLELMPVRVTERATDRREASRGDRRTLPSKPLWADRRGGGWEPR